MSVVPAAIAVQDDAPPRKRQKLSDMQRHHIVGMAAGGERAAEIARVLGLQADAVRMHMKRVRDGGSIDRPKGHGGGKRLPAEQRAAIVQAAETIPGATLEQMAHYTETATGHKPTRKTVSHILKQEGFTRKRLRAEAVAKNGDRTKDARKAWVEQWAPILTQDNTIYFDESALNASIAPEYGWTRVGQPAVKPTLVWKGLRVSVIGAFSCLDGLSIKVLEDKETVDNQDFYKFMRRIAQEYKRKQTDDMYFIYDNASVHKTDELSAMLQRQSEKFHPLPLPPYSPRLNPIENMWHTLKAPVKREELTDGESVRRALTKARDELQISSFPHYFKHMHDKIYPLAVARSDMH